MSPGEGGATVFDLSVGLAFSLSLGFSLVVRFAIVVWRGRKFRYELRNILTLLCTLIPIVKQIIQSRPTHTKAGVLVIQ